jgi:hypothetical protein
MKQVLPSSVHPDVRLVHSPRYRLVALKSTHSLLMVRCIEPHTTTEGGWVNVDTVLLRHLGNVALADAILAQYQRLYSRMGST